MVALKKKISVIAYCKLHNFFKHLDAIQDQTN